MKLLQPIITSLLFQVTILTLTISLTVYYIQCTHVQTLQLCFHTGDLMQIALRKSTVPKTHLVIKPHQYYAD